MSDRNRMVETPTEFYREVLELGVQVESHYGDLYIPVTPETTDLVARYGSAPSVAVFKSQIEGNDWYDIPFAYVPWWEACASRKPRG